MTQDKKRDLKVIEISQNEWDFSDTRLAKAELSWCFRYEYSRTSPAFLEQTVQWRKKHKDATKYFASAIAALLRFGESESFAVFPSLAKIVGDAWSMEHPLDMGEPEINKEAKAKQLGQAFETGFLVVLPHLTKLYEAVFGKKDKRSRLLFAACQMDFDYFMLLDERFPKQGYLDADLSYRLLKFFLLNQFFEPELDSKLDADFRSAIKARAFWKTGHLHARFDSQNPDSRTEMHGKFAHQYFVAGVNWARSNDVIVAEFRQWLVENRPHPHYDTARKTNERDLLKVLGALRLRQVMSWEDAQRHTKSILGYPLYSGEKSWKRAVAKANLKLKEPFVPFTGLLARRAK